MKQIGAAALLVLLLGGLATFFVRALRGGAAVWTNAALAASCLSPKPAEVTAPSAPAALRVSAADCVEVGDGPPADPGVVRLSCASEDADAPRGEVLFPRAAWAVLRGAPGQSEVFP